EAAKKDIDALKEEVGRLRREVEALRRKQADASRESRFGAVPIRTGAIRLVNAYVLPMTVIVNGTRYPLEPGETRVLRGQPPGTFVYEIPGVREPVRRTLEGNETFTIRIHAR